MNIIIFGPPLAGKGTQSKKIVDDFRLTHLSTGDALRAAKKSGSELGLKAAEYSNKGLLAPDELVDAVVEKFCITHKSDSGILFDGYPRNISQANFLNTLLKNNDSKIDLILALKVEKSELLRRAKIRAEKEDRKDDRDSEIVLRRINEYENLTLPTIEFFEKNHAKVIEIDGSRSIDEIYSIIESKLKSLK